MKRRTFLSSTCCVATYALLPGLVSCNNIRDKKDNQLVFIGTYTSRGSEGIYICRFNNSSGRLSLLRVKKNITDPSFLAVHPNRSFLYAVNEVSEFEGKAEGGVSAFRIDKESGELHFLNHQVSGGAHPCHLTVSKNGRFIMAGNYSGGNFSVLPIASDGSLLPPAQLIQHEGSGLDPKRQKSPHVHCLVLNRENTHLLAADLGMDKIVVYPFDENTGRIDDPGSFFLSAEPGAGPRHLAFSPGDKFLYCINELNSTITVYPFDRSRSTTGGIQAVSTLPADFRDSNTCADIHVHPGGKFLYGSNRGHDSIVLYSRNNKTGMLNLTEIISSGGRNPRNFAIDPSGNFLLAANQSSNNVVSFRIDPETGQLQPEGGILEIPAPVCVKFL